MSEPWYSQRGFANFEPIDSTYGGCIRAYESSSANSPHVWVSILAPIDRTKTVPEGMESACAHLTLESATLLRDQLTWLIDNHYQVKVRPDTTGGVDLMAALLDSLDKAREERRDG